MSNVSDSIGLWGSGQKETKLDIIRDIGKVGQVKTLLISNLKISTLRKIRKSVNEGFTLTLKPGSSKSECLEELHKIFPDLERSTPLIGMQNLIEVVNKCQKA